MAIIPYIHDYKKYVLIKQVKHKSNLAMSYNMVKTIVVDEALENALMLEEVARLALYTKYIDPHIGKIDPSLLNRHYLRKHGKTAYYGQ